MTIKGFFNKFGSKTAGQDDDSGDTAAESPISNQKMIEQLLEAMTRQDRQIDRLVSELGALGDATEKLASAGHEQSELANTMRESLDRQEQRRDDAMPVVMDLSETAAQQVQLLETIRDRLSGVSGATPESPETQEQSNKTLQEIASHLAEQSEMLTHLRATAEAGNDYLADIISVNVKWSARLAIAAIIAGGLIAAGLVLHALLAG